MQSWGTQSRFSERDTGLEPSKSGVVGLLCAALGRPRTEPLDDLARLQMGVRVDREGVMRVDYHTASGVPGPAGGGYRTVLSNRYYLADADFLVGLEGDRSLLEAIDQALMRPRWQLFLGRKSFVPGVPVRLPDTPPWGPGLRETNLEEALTSYPWLGRQHQRARDAAPGRLRLVLEANLDISTEARMDVPLSFSERRFTTRYVRTDWVRLPAQEEVA